MTCEKNRCRAREVAGNVKRRGLQSRFSGWELCNREETPGDFDLCWLAMGVDEKKLDPIILDCSSEGRKKQKAKYGGEVFSLNDGCD
jgi:hypothetical protein